MFDRCTDLNRASRLERGLLLPLVAAPVVEQGEGTSFSSAGAPPAAALEKIRQAMARYSARLTREGTLIDLRGLGAQIPALSADEADARIKVSTGPSNERAKSELLWAFMRRGRVVLTGLPGGGKSTSIKKLAAQLCALPGAPMPVRVSLLDVDALDHSMSFRDRLIAAAIRDDKADDRPLLRRQIEQHLDNGAIALLLDSLDETYDHRATVVGEIEALLTEASPDVDVLLATRDVAYGHAATLGWPNLRLRAPEAISHRRVQDNRYANVRRAVAYFRSGKRSPQDLILHLQAPLVPTQLGQLTLLRARQPQLAPVLVRVGLGHLFPRTRFADRLGHESTGSCVHKCWVTDLRRVLARYRFSPGCTRPVGS